MSRNWLSAVVYGTLASIVIILATAFLLASLLRFTSFTESGGAALPIIVSIIALFLGGVIAGAKTGEKGLLIGGITGIAYCLFSFLFQYLGMDQALGLKQYLFFAANIAAAAVGGVTGVNLFTAKH